MWLDSSLESPEELSSHIQDRRKIQLKSSLFILQFSSKKEGIFDKVSCSFDIFLVTWDSPVSKLLTLWLLFKIPIHTLYTPPLYRQALPLLFPIYARAHPFLVSLQFASQTKLKIQKIEIIPTIRLIKTSAIHLL